MHINPSPMTVDARAEDQALTADRAPPCLKEWLVLRRRVGVPDDHGTDLLIEEAPVALIYNGVSHAVMLATPSALDDLALGFSLTEGVVEDRSEIFDLSVQQNGEGWVVEMQIPQRRFTALKERRRNLAGRTGCGLCGLDSLSALPRIAPQTQPRRVALPTPGAIDVALRSLRCHQPLFEDSGAAHGAAWVEANGAIQIAREDVGRHNALDKLIGALHAGRQPDPRALEGGGFVLITSRASYEMVQKVAAIGGCILVAVSAPTAMAVRAAQAAGMALIGFARDGSSVVYQAPPAPV